MRVNFVLLAKGTALNVSADEGGESGPPELGSNQLTCFQETGVSGRCMIMTACEDGAAKGVVHRDIDTSFVSEDTCFDLPVSESGSKGKRNVLVHRLESLEDEGVTCRSRFNAVGEGGVDEVNEKGGWKEGDISVVGVIRREKVRAAGEGIWPGQEFSGDMDHFEVKVCEVNKPACLAAVERLGLAEISKVLVVGEDLYGEGGAVEVVAPGLQGANNGEKLPVINIVITFSGGEGL